MGNEQSKSFWRHLSEVLNRDVVSPRVDMWVTGVTAGIGAVLAVPMLPLQMGWILLALSAVNARHTWRLYRKLKAAEPPSDPRP
jgi:hypothetical protein